MTRWMAVVMVIGSAGCSFLTATTPKGASQSCMPNRGAVAGDAVVVASVAPFYIASAECHGDGCVVFIIPDVIFTALALPYLASAIYGAVKDRCPEATRAP